MTDEPEEGHSHRLPTSLLVFVFVIAVGLLTAIVLSYVAARSTDQRLAALEDYVQGRGEFRDREAARMNAEWQERLRQTQCDLLDQFPEGGWLDRPRAKYGCGPGIPLDQLPPDVADNLRQQRGGQPATPSASPAPAPTSPPADRPQAAPGPPPAPAPSAPTSEPPPRIDLGTVGDMACDSVRVCF